VAESLAPDATLNQNAQSSSVETPLSRAIPNAGTTVAAAQGVELPKAKPVR